MILTLVQFLNQIRYEGDYKIKWDTGEPLDSYAWIADPAVVIRKSSRTEKVYIEQLSKTFHHFPECTERGWHVISQQRHNWNYPSLLRNKNHFVYWDAMIGRIISQRLRWKVLADFHFVTALLSAGSCPSWSLSMTEPNSIHGSWAIRMFCPPNFTLGKVDHCQRREHHVLRIVTGVVLRLPFGPGTLSVCLIMSKMQKTEGWHCPSVLNTPKHGRRPVHSAENAINSATTYSATVSTAVVLHTQDKDSRFPVYKDWEEEQLSSIKTGTPTIPADSSFYINGSGHRLHKKLRCGIVEGEDMLMKTTIEMDKIKEVANRTEHLYSKIVGDLIAHHRR